MNAEARDAIRGHLPSRYRIRYRDVWMQVSNKKDFNRALSRIDRLLSSSPRKHGHELSEGLLAIDVLPLKVFFEIDDEHHKVFVTGIAFLDD